MIWLFMSCFSRTCQVILDVLILQAGRGALLSQEHRLLLLIAASGIMMAHCRCVCLCIALSVDRSNQVTIAAVFDYWVSSEDCIFTAVSDQGFGVVQIVTAIAICDGAGRSKMILVIHACFRVAATAELLLHPWPIVLRCPAIDCRLTITMVSFENTDELAGEIIWGMMSLQIGLALTMPMRSNTIFWGCSWVSQGQSCWSILLLQDNTVVICSSLCIQWSRLSHYLTVLIRLEVLLRYKDGCFRLLVPVTGCFYNFYDRLLVHICASLIVVRWCRGSCYLATLEKHKLFLFIL